MGLQFGLVFPPVADNDVDHEEISVTQIGATALAAPLNDTLPGFAGGEVDNAAYVGNDGDDIVGTVTTVGKNGQKTATPFTVKLVDDLAPAASGAPTVKVLSRTA